MNIAHNVYNLCKVFLVDATNNYLLCSKERSFPAPHTSINYVSQQSLYKLGVPWDHSQQNSWSHSKDARFLTTDYTVVSEMYHSDLQGLFTSQASYNTHKPWKPEQQKTNHPWSLTIQQMINQSPKKNPFLKNLDKQNPQMPTPLSE